MITFVIDSRNNVGHPTRKGRMVRRLLKKGKAKVLKGGLKKGQPLLIQLLDKVFNKSKTIKADFRIGIDPGYKHIGYSVFKIYTKKDKSNHIELLLTGEVETRTFEITKNLSDRKMYRNTRRYYRRKNVKRKFDSAKFRHPRWKNRAKHMFQLTHRHLITSHINLLKWIFKRIPKNQCELHLEYNNFDIQKIINPKIQGNQYQQGLQYGFENIKSYIRNRDNYTCQICKKKIANIRNEVHHIIPKSKGGSNRPDNLILLCQDCHKKVHTGKAVCSSKLIKNKDFRDTGVLNSCMKWMYENFSKKIPIVKTYGYITKAIRLAKNISKTHAHDAMIIALCNEDGFETEFIKYTNYDHHITVNFKQYRRHIRFWTNRLEDRKYYLIDNNSKKKCIAHNRRRRTGQAKKHLNLEEYRQQYPKAQLIAKPGGAIMKQSEKKMTFRRGDIIKCPKGVATVQHYVRALKKLILCNLAELCVEIVNYHYPKGIVASSEA